VTWIIAIGEANGGTWDWERYEWVKDDDSPIATR
jgi:hypothetical protein